jgi:type VI secretion system secreted protein VgrG
MTAGAPNSYVLTCANESLHLRSATLVEEMSRLFEFQIVALSSDPAISSDDLLGTDGELSIATGDGTQRILHGVVASFGIDGVDGRMFRYRLTLRPWLWLATRASNIRIFQEKTALEIVQEVLEPYGGTVSTDVQASLATRTYCVQYRESDFNFVARLLEEEGIFWFFRHAAGQHELVLADHAGAFEPAEGFASVSFLEGGPDPQAPAALHEWRMRHEIQTGKFVLNDYNMLTPGTALKSDPAAGTRGHAQAEHESYDYPALVLDKAAADARAAVRLDEANSRFARFHAEGNTPGVAVGAKLTLANHPRDDQNADYVVLRTQIELSQGGFESGAAQTMLAVRCELQPHAEPVRPQRIARKPAVQGPQTAVVVGGGNPGSIETDEHARVKVQFHWDRLGQKNAESSCWIRVASPWAGNGWGSIQIPRVGQEVVVDFLEGDPDQPLITGRVHNAEQKPPYELPANASVSTIKSRSMEQGAADKFNELRFDDKDGAEYLLMQSQKDKFEFVEETVKTLIGKFEHRTVVDNSFEHIKGERHEHVVKDAFRKVDKSQHLDVGEKLLVKTGDVFSVKATKDLTMASDATISLKSAKDMHIKSGPNMGLEAQSNVYIKGMAVVIEGTTQVSLKVGGSFIDVGPSGIAIKGPIVQINTGGAAGSGTAPSPVATTDPTAATDAEEPTDPLNAKHR